MLNKSQPKYRHYRPKNLAVVRIDGRDRYLGAYDSPESWEKYHRLIAEHMALASESPRTQMQPSFGRGDLSVSELVNRYRQFAEQYYVKNGKATKELADMKYACRPLRTLYGTVPVAQFGPLALKAVREYMISNENLSRGVVNHRINRIRRVFKWGVSEELVPSSIFEALRSVQGLRFGRCNARETEPVRPVPWADVEPVLPVVSRQVATMIQLQWLTAMRPCEVVSMQAADIERNGDIWVYEPADHKNRWRGHRRLIPLGPKAQELLCPFLKQSTDGCIFSPRQAESERNTARKRNRRTPMTPSHRTRKSKRQPKRAKREFYQVSSYRRAIEYGIAKLNRQRAESEQIPNWYPLQLRHSRATELRKLFGLEAAQVALGHARADVTQIYAERNLEQAVKIARDVG